MENENSIIGKINSLLPILTVLVIVYGVLKLTIYYTFFHINILSYLDFTELIPSIVRDLIYSIIVVALLILAARISGGKKFIYNEETTEGTSKFERFKIYLSSYGFMNYIIFLTFISPIICIIFFKMTFSEWYYTYSYWVALCIIIIANRELISLIVKYNSKLAQDKAFQFVVLCSLGSILLGINRGLDNHHNLITGIEKNTSYIEIGDKVIKSSKEYYYIGKTKSAVFFYDAINKRTDIYPSSIITKMSVYMDQY